MRHRRRRRLRICLLGIAAAAGCSGAPRSTVTPEVELVGLDLRGAAADGQQFVLTLLVDNPNPEPLSIAEIRYSVRVASEGYLNGRSAPVELAPFARQTVRVELVSDAVSSASRLLALARAPDDSLDYELSGELVLNGRPPRTLRFARRGGVPLTIAPSN